MRTKLWAGLGVVAGAGLGLWAMRRATHPAEAELVTHPRGPERALDPGLFVMPDGTTEHTVPTRDGGSLRVVEKGAGQPLVLLHGVTLRAEVWSPQFHQLADRYRVIALDLRGHGQSTVGEDGFGLANLGRDVVDLLEHLDLTDAVVVGHSMGGMTVMRFCADHPEVVSERVAAVMFVASAPDAVIPASMRPYLVELLERGSRAAEVDGAWSRSELAGTRGARLAFGAGPAPAAVALVAAQTGSMPDEATIASLHGIITHDARESLKELNVPATVVVGTRDLITPVRSSRAMARWIPDCRFVVLAGCGHQIMQERPFVLARLIDELAERTATVASAESA